jgi:peroxiredoxin
VGSRILVAVHRLDRAQRLAPHRGTVGAAVLAVVAALVLLLTGCGGGSAGLGGGMLNKRQSTPKISGQTLDGQQLDVNTLRGKVVVLNFYASWCGPCRAETPLLEKVYQQEHAAGVDMVGVLYKDTKANGSSFREHAGVTYPSLVDTDGTLLPKFKGVNASGIPVTFVLARDGKVAARWIGPIHDQSALTTVLQTLLAEPA